MTGLAVTIRLLDPPLHEFLPNLPELLEELSEMKLALRRGRSIRAMDKLLDEIDEKRRLLTAGRAPTREQPHAGS